VNAALERLVWHTPVVAKQECGMRRNLESAFGEQGLPQGYGFVAVDLKYADRRPTDRGAAAQNGSLVVEVVRPFMAAGIEKTG
jgi:hypothetical protein